ncbi:MAG TPA: hopanoid biosynthesis associated radical SAM protein HpnH, partial [Cupriavidus sp.]|nr:hopanoid biosynthesis associated radical SAM protein HpnH [Cupriavidus sp.]
VKTDGPMAPDIPLDKQRPAEYVFSRHVEIKLAEIGNLKKAQGSRAEAAQAAQVH